MANATSFREPSVSDVVIEVGSPQDKKEEMESPSFPPSLLVSAESFEVASSEKARQ